MGWVKIQSIHTRKREKDTPAAQKIISYSIFKYKNKNCAKSAQSISKFGRFE